MGWIAAIKSILAIKDMEHKMNDGLMVNMAKRHIEVIKEEIDKEMQKDEKERNEFRIEGLTKLLKQKEKIVKKYKEKHTNKKLNNDKFFSREW